MRNSGVAGIVILAIICYAIMAIGAIIAIIAAIIALFFLIKWIIKLVKNKKSETKSKRLFYDNLCNKYQIPQISHKTNINTLLSELIDTIINKHKCSSQQINEFSLFSDSIKLALEECTTWINDVILTDYSYNSSSLTRNSLEFKLKGFYAVKENFNVPCFTIVAQKNKIYFYPYFVITEIDNEYEMINYSDIICGKRNLIYVEESLSSIKGATPAYYNYLYQRVDGGPDRRYKYNPSTPVYHYSSFKIVLGKEVQFICANNNSASKIIDAIKKYQNTYQNIQIQSITSVRDIDLSKNEYLSLIKELIMDHGKEFILSKFFINYIKDYRVPKEYPYFLPIFDLLNRTNSLERIIQNDFNCEELDVIKDDISKLSNYSETEISTVLALLYKAIYP